MKTRCLAPALLLLPVLLAASVLTPQEENGKRIYLEGASASGGEIVAVMGEGVEVPAAAVPCAGCHGRDGRGRPEGGVSPSDITWSRLSRPYGATHPSGRRHPPYDERLLKRAIAMGIDPAGNPLHVAMPRFRMSLGDMADLVAYTKKLGLEDETGVSGQEVRIGLVLPPAGPLAPLGEAVRSALAGRFEQINREGGVYGRRLELRTFEAPAGPPESRRDAVAGFLEREEIFAGVAAFFSGADAGLAALFADRQVPLIGPFTLHTPDASTNRHVFYLQPGFAEQGRVLAGFARSHLGLASPRPAVLAPADAIFDATVEAIESACSGWAPATGLRYVQGSFDPEDLARRLQGADPVIFLGSGPEAVRLARALEGLVEPGGRPPYLLLTGGAADGSLFAAPRAFQGRIFLAVPDLAPGPESLQRAALAAAEVLHEGLRRAGRNLTRERLIEALEGLRGFHTGVSLPVTYAPGRRLGIRDSWVMSVDVEGRRLVPVPREP